jgi:hypothetical protein
MSMIKLDLNNAQFQKDFLTLEKIELFALTKTLKKISKLSWPELYADNGLKWEAIINKHTKSGEKIYSFRFSQKYRATAIREGETMKILTLNIDHDSTYS